MKPFLLLRFGLLGCFFLLCPMWMQATHIVGGEVTYRFLSRDAVARTNTYSLAVKIYRNCFGPEVAALDGALSFGVYVGNNQTPLRFDFNPFITAYLDSTKRLPLPTYPCLTPPQDVCVEEGFYSVIVTLPDTNATYTFSYQRCCRNGTISNIVGPGGTGATFTTQISPLAFSSRNNSPTFNQFPPTVICLGEPLIFNHSASDIEGDQLVYEFVAPLAGGSSSMVTARAPPPFLPVNFVLPNYSAAAPMGGNPTIRIDPNTGIITGTPTVLGQFVVGVRVSEYRNGVLIGSISRDFQFNVKRCRPELAINVNADSVRQKTYFINSCTNRPFTLVNNSVNNDPNPTYEWVFPIPNDTPRRYFVRNPTITFPDTGYYVGRMYANRATACGDSIEVRVVIGSGLQSDFALSYDTCSATPVVFNNRTRLGYRPVRRWQWAFGDGTVLDTNALSNPSHQYQTAGIKSVRLTVTDQFGCQHDTLKTFAWQPSPPILIVEPDNFVGCAPSRVTFRNRSLPADSTYRILWDFGDGSTGNTFNTSHEYQSAGTYNIRLTITSPLNCSKSSNFSQLITIRPTPTANFDWTERDINNLGAGTNVHFRDSSSSDVRTWRWFFNSRNYSAQRNPTFNFGRDTGMQSVFLTVFNQYGCRDSMRKWLYVKPVVTFFMPTAFTPNYDTMNDAFKGTGFTYGMRDFELSVWSRYGEPVFRTIDPNEGWNGRKNNIGEPVPEGAYLYQLRYRTPLGEIVEKRDFLTLFR
jgi:gliding motility-associated-like protein